MEDRLLRDFSGEPLHLWQHMGSNFFIDFSKIKYTVRPRFNGSFGV